MKTTLWIIIVIIVGFVGFLMGYSRPHAARPAATWAQHSQQGARASG